MVPSPLAGPGRRPLHQLGLAPAYAVLRRFPASSLCVSEKSYSPRPKCHIIFSPQITFFLQLPLFLPEKNSPTFNCGLHPFLPEMSPPPPDNAYTTRLNQRLRIVPGPNNSLSAFCFPSLSPGLTNSVTLLTCFSHKSFLLPRKKFVGLTLYYLALSQPFFKHSFIEE